MRGTRTLRIKAVVTSRADIGDLLTAPGDAVLVERGRPRLLVLACPCGCGEIYPVNLDHRAGQAWRLYGDNRRGFSLFPSVWRDTGCESHFIVWRDQIYVLGPFEDDLEALQTDEASQLLDNVRAKLSRELTSFSAIADAIQAVPWDVLLICRRLVRMGIAEEGDGDERAMFRQK